MTLARCHTLGVHLSSRGFGWALFDGPRSLLDWGVAVARTNKNEETLRRIAILVYRYRPGALVVEQHAANERSERIRELYRDAIEYAQECGITVHCYSRAQIASSNQLKGARTRSEVAEAVANCLEELRPRLPRRRIWLGERLGMALFCAAACVLVHYEIASADPLFELSRISVSRAPGSAE